ncbi:MAG: lipoyl(octanoyl) transferase LipB [Proteobacteria bacterium]|nr:lipoyl(octanoyl) transferase LipB [Pseudomonadota bacterium]
MAIIVRQLGLCDYQQTWDTMRNFVDAATTDSDEEIWLLQHPPVYTLGRSGKREHLLRETAIALIHSDRGGQITYHAPGQLVAYLMLNISRRRLGLRHLVRALETAIINFLAVHNIIANGDNTAPGVYVDGAKIAALGLRLRRGWSYHGISLNVNMDLAPFGDINPCGYQGLAVTQIVDLLPTSPPLPSLDALQSELTQHLLAALNATEQPAAAI